MPAVVNASASDNLELPMHRCRFNTGAGHPRLYGTRQKMQMEKFLMNYPKKLALVTYWNRAMSGSRIGASRFTWKTIESMKIPISSTGPTCR